MNFRVLGYGRLWLLGAALLTVSAGASAIPPPPPPPPWAAPELERRYEALMAESSRLSRRISERMGVFRSVVERQSRGPLQRADWERLRSAIRSFREDREQMRRLIGRMQALAREPRVRSGGNEHSLVLHRVETMMFALHQREQTYADLLSTIIERLPPPR